MLHNIYNTCSCDLPDGPVALVLVHIHIRQITPPMLHNNIQPTAWADQRVKCAIWQLYQGFTIHEKILGWEKLVNLVNCELFTNILATCQLEIARELFQLLKYLLD